MARASRPGAGVIELVTGSRGFLGRHVVTALPARGHRVVAGVSAQRPPSAGDERTLPVDFTRDVDAETWLARLDGIECVINTVGIVAEEGARQFEAVHVDAPAALFAACAAPDVRTINVSALGADAGARTAFHRSKRAADAFLLAHHPAAVAVQPSLAFGIATIAWPRRRLWRAQAAVIVFYTVVVTLFLPQFWLHPYGPIVKNLPLLALLALLHAETKR